jgi:hypothetical protein
MLVAIIPDDSSAATAAHAHQLGDVMRLDYDCAGMCRSMRKRSAPFAGFPQVMPMIHAGESKMSGLSRTANAPVNAVTSAVVVMISVVSIRMMIVRVVMMVIPVMMLARNCWKRPYHQD